MTSTETIDTYVVRCQLGTGKRTQDLNVQLIASDERAALSRARGTLFHSQRNMDWMTDASTFTVLATVPGIVTGNEILTEADLAHEDAICELCYSHSSAHEWVVVAPDTHVVRCSISEDASDVEDES